MLDALMSTLAKEKPQAKNSTPHHRAWQSGAANICGKQVDLPAEYGSRSFRGQGIVAKASPKASQNSSVHQAWCGVRVHVLRLGFASKLGAMSSPPDFSWSLPALEPSDPGKTQKLWTPQPLAEPWAISRPLRHFWFNIPY